MKLKKEDIVILSEGSQAKRAIFEKYGSFENFIKTNNYKVEVSAIKQYCKGGVIKNELFKCRLAQSLDKGYPEIVVSKEDQIRKYVLKLFHDIYDYNQEDDIEVLDYVKDLCYKNSMDVEYGLMHRNIGFYYYNLNKIDSAVRMFKVGLELLEKRSQYGYLVLCSSDLGLIYLYQAEYGKAMEVFDRADGFLNRCFGLDESYLYFYYYRKGIVLNNVDRYEEARRSLEQSLVYTKDNHLISCSLSNIGIAWKRENNLDKALEYYSKTLDVTLDDDVKENFKKTKLYNNIAEAYRVKSEFSKALKNVELAFNYDPKTDMEVTYIIFFTYYQIKHELGDELSIISKVIEIADNMSRYIKNKSFICKPIKLMVDIYAKSYDERLFTKLSDVIINLICSTTPDAIYTNELKACLGELYLIKVKGRDHIV